MVFTNTYLRFTTIILNFQITTSTPFDFIQLKVKFKQGFTLGFNQIKCTMRSNIFYTNAIALLLWKLSSLKLIIMRSVQTIHFNCEGK